MIEDRLWKFVVGVINAIGEISKQEAIDGLERIWPELRPLPWQPIETAPREAIVVAAVVSGHWAVGEAWLHEDGRWYWAWSTPPYDSCRGPIDARFWQPLPPVPDRLPNA